MDIKPSFVYSRSACSANLDQLEAPHVELACAFTLLEIPPGFALSGFIFLKALIFCPYQIAIDSILTTDCGIGPSSSELDPKLYVLKSFAGLRMNSLLLQ